jgi:hypothetical protein
MQLACSTPTRPSRRSASRRARAALLLCLILPVPAMALTSFPVEPQVVAIGNPDTTVTQVSMQRVDGGYNVTSTYDGLQFYWTTPADLGAGAPIEFDIRSDDSSMKLEFIDAFAEYVSITLTNLTPSYQTVSIPASTLLSANPDFQQTHMNLINFVIEDWRATNKIGGFSVVTGGGLPQLPITPGANTNLSNLPGKPSLISLSHPNATLAVTQGSTNFFRATYDVSFGGTYAGPGLDFGGAGADFSGMTSLVFQIQGSPQRIKLEVVDGDQMVFILLKDIVTNAPGWFQVPLSYFQARGIDLAAIRAMHFIIDQDLAGSGNHTGSFDVRVNGLRASLDFTPDVNTQVSTLPGKPTPDKFGFGNFDTAVYNQFNSTNHFQLQYNVATGGFTGVGIGFPAPVDLTTFTSLVFGVKGHPSKLKVEFADNVETTATTIASFSGFDAGSISYFQVPISSLAQSPTLLDRIVQIAFVVDPGLAGAGNEIGSFDIYVNGLGLSLAFTPDVNTNISTLPNNPTADKFGFGNFDTAVYNQFNSTNHFQLQYNVATGGFTGVGIGFPSPADLTGMTSLVFGIKGNPDRLRLEFGDNDTNTATTIVAISGFTTDTVSYIQLPLAALETGATHMDQVTFIGFVIEQGLAAAGNEIGSFDVYINGFPVSLSFTPDTNADITTLPGQPAADKFGFGNFDTAVFKQFGSTNHFQLQYNVATGGFTGVGLNFPAPVDLTAFTSIVFGVQGHPDRIKIEFGDNIATTATTIAYVGGFGTGSVSYFQLPLASLLSGQTRMDQVTFMGFIVDQGLAGGGAYEGSFDVYVGGLARSTVYGPDANTNLTTLPASPAASKFGFGNFDTASFTQFGSTNHFRLNYNVSTGGFIGVSLAFPNPVDLAAFTSIVIAADGDPQAINVEFGDNIETTATTIVRLSGLSTNATQYYQLPMAALQAGPTHMDSITFIAFVVDPGLAGAGHEIGRFDIRVNGLRCRPLPVPNAELMFLPGQAPVSVLADGASLPLQTLKLFESNFFGLVYNVTNAGSFAGALINFDSGATTNQETADLSSYTSLVFGVRGTTPTLKMEINDANPATPAVAIYLDAITTNLAYYHVPAWCLTGAGINMAEISTIAAVVEPGVAHPALTGYFDVFVRGLDASQLGAWLLFPTSGAPISLLPGSPSVGVLPGSITGTTVSAISTQRFGVSYVGMVSNGPVAGASLNFDVAGTPSLETADLTPLGELVLQARRGQATNGPVKVKIQFVDSWGTGTEGYLMSVATNDQLYRIDLAEVSRRGGDAARITEVRFFTDRSAAGPQYTNGIFEVNVQGLFNYDADGDGLPDAWEVATFGSTTNAADEDADGDGVSNWREYVAGTSPTNSGSVFEAETFSYAGSNRRVIRWSSVTGRTYDVLRTTSLAVPPDVIAADVPATPPVNAYTDTVGSASSYFYGIQVGD